MAWIESHQQIERHPKTLKLMELMNWTLNETVGSLHRFWYWCVDFAEDGDLRKFTDIQLGCAVGIYGDQAKTFIGAMLEARWLDRAPYFRVHDWWTYIGRFLQVKYKAAPEKWQAVRAKYVEGRLPHGQADDDAVNNNRCYNRSNNHIPNLTKPNLTKPKTSLSSDSVEIGLSELLFGLIRGRNPTCKEPNMQAWARNIDLMIRIDHRDPNEIRELIQLCQKDDFWQNNILSTEKLRKQYDQLKLKLMLLKGQEPPGRRIPPECNGCKKEQCNGCEYEGKWA